MKKLLFTLSVLGTMFLFTGCISGERLLRNSPFNGKYHGDSINLWPLYYQAGENCSILFPLIDIDDRGFSVRPFYVTEKDEHAVLWPLCGFDSMDGWAGTFFWSGKNSFGLLPLFAKTNDFVWIFPASWYSNKSCAILPLFMKDKDFLWICNVFKSEDMFLIFPFYGQGKDWVYFLNFIYSSSPEDARKSLWMLPLAYYNSNQDETALYSPLFSFEYRQGQLNMLNIALLLYHYSNGKHHVFYPIADINWNEYYHEYWLWPLFYNGKNASSNFPFFLFDYSDGSTFQEFSIFNPLIFSYRLNKNSQKSETRILPFGALWYYENSVDAFDQRILGGAVFQNTKDADSRYFSLLYKLFSYQREKENVKWEFFPFIKIMNSPEGSSWSFLWRLLEKHNGGGHIFFIPWGKDENEIESDTENGSDTKSAAGEKNGNAMEKENGQNTGK